MTTQTGEEVYFKIKRNTKLSKLQGAYASKVGKDVNSIRCVLVVCLCSTGRACAVAPVTSAGVRVLDAQVYAHAECLVSEFRCA